MFLKTSKNVGPFKDLDILKIAVQYDKYTAQLIEFNQRQPLAEIIRNLCNYPDWGITDANSYSLQFYEPVRFVTEENRGNVKNGAILVLTSSAVKIVDDIIQTLQTDVPDDKTECLIKLCELAKDVTFANEFIKLKGLDIIIRFLNNDKHPGNSLAYKLIAFSELMEHGIRPWRGVENLIIRRIIRFISPTFGPHIIQPALQILENIVQNSANPENIDIKFETLLKILEMPGSTELVHENVIAVINSVFQVSSDQRKAQIIYDFSTKRYLDVINSSVIKVSMGNELRYELYVLQSLLFSKYSNATLSAHQNNDFRIKIDELKRVAFYESNASVLEVDTLKRPNKSHSKLRYKLGFKSENNIEESFTKTPLGLLPLDCLVYFAHTYSTLYKNIIAGINLTTDEYEFPLGEISIQLMKIVCELLRIGEPLSEQGGTFHPLFFSHEQPLHEFFCICIEVINVTWKDMKATSKDFDKVITVAREQITRSLDGQPLTLNDFKRNLKTFTYSKINELREEERASREEYESTVSTIVELKQKLTPQILSIIKKQRLDYLVQGSHFHHYSKSWQRLKEKFWYARLSHNLRTLYYGDCNEYTIPTVEDLNNQINVADIKQLLIGKDCPISKRKGQMASKCLFAVVYLDQSLQPREPLEFMATSELIQNYWVDGLSVLLKLAMSSSRLTEDLDTLLSMEIKLRLLDTDGFIIDKAPPIPADPQDYNF